MGRKELLKDVKEVEETYSKSDSKIKDLLFDGENTISFALQTPSGEQLSLSLCLPDNYPKGEYTLIGSGKGLAYSSEMKMFSAGTLSDTFKKIVEDHWKKERSKLKSSGRKKLASSVNSEDGDDGEEEGEDDYMDEAFTEKPGSIGNWSQTKEVLEDIDTEEAAQHRKKLDADIAYVKQNYKRAGYYHDQITHEYTVRLVMDTAFLDKWTAAAWSVNNTMPIIIELLFTWQYLNYRKMPPKVLRIVQSSDKDLNVKEIKHTVDFGLRWYLLNRLSDILRRNWVKYYRTAEDDIFLKAVKKETEAVNSDVANLIKLGFGRKLATLAFERAKGDRTKAAALLMDSETLAKLETESESHKEAESFSEPFYTGLPGHSPKEIEQVENFFGNYFGVSKLTSSKDGPNFFAKLLDYLSVRLKACSSTCMICDVPLGYEGLKPSVCTKPLCTHSFDSYGLGFSLVGELTHNDQVVDLLISTTVAAARNKRANGADVFDPFPSAIQVIKRKSPNEGGGEQVFSFLQNGKKLIDELATVCDKLPSVAEMKKCTDEQKLKEMLDAQDPLCFPLIRWIMMSNRCHISPLPKDKHIKEMDTEFQFVLDNPAKEAAFRRRRAEIAKKKGGRGSFYVRIGLKNYSNSNKMSTGAAYGPGIYMASHASTSFSYMVPGNTWHKSAIGKGGNLACIALVEVLDLRGENGCPIADHGSILTCTDETIVTTRYFFIYPSNSSSYGYGSNRHNAAANGLKLPEDIYS